MSARPRFSSHSPYEASSHSHSNSVSVSPLSKKFDGFSSRNISSNYCTWRCSNVSNSSSRWSRCCSWYMRFFMIKKCFSLFTDQLDLLSMSHKCGWLARAWFWILEILKKKSRLWLWCAYACIEDKNLHFISLHFFTSLHFIVYED